MTNSKHLSGFIKAAVAGAAVATVCDANHVFTGTLRYPQPVVFGQPLWVFPGFFAVFMGMAALYWFLANILEGKFPAKQAPRIMKGRRLRKPCCFS